MDLFPLPTVLLIALGIFGFVIFGILLFALIFACKWSPNRATQPFYTRFQGGIQLLWLLTASSGYTKLRQYLVKSYLLPIFGYGYGIDKIEWKNNYFQTICTMELNKDCINRISPKQFCKSADMLHQQTLTLVFLWEKLGNFVQRKQRVFKATYMIVEYRITVDHVSNKRYLAWYDMSKSYTGFPPLPMDKYWKPKISMARNQPVVDLAFRPNLDDFNASIMPTNDYNEGITLSEHEKPLVPSKFFIPDEKRPDMIKQFTQTRGPELLLPTDKLPLPHPHVWPIELLEQLFFNKRLGSIAMRMLYQDKDFIWAYNLSPLQPSLGKEKYGQNNDKQS